MLLGHKGFSGGMDFIAGNNYDESKCLHPKYDDKGNIIINVMMCVWFTNIDHKKRHEELDLYRKYNENDYSKYDNYDAIEVPKVADIPMDYDGVMGVPITFLDKYCPSQFEILWLASGHSKTSMPKEITQIVNANFQMKSKENTGNGYAILNKHQLYHRILIKRRL